MTTTLTLNEWTSSRGQRRRYVRNLGAVIGLQVRRYKTGNIAEATFDGEHLSNSAAGRLLGLRVWLDDDNTVHVDGWCDGTERYHTSPEQIAERVTAAYQTMEK